MDEKETIKYYLMQMALSLAGREANLPCPLSVNFSKDGKSTSKIGNEVIPFNDNDKEEMIALKHILALRIRLFIKLNSTEIDDLLKSHINKTDMIKTTLERIPVDQLDIVVPLIKLVLNNYLKELQESTAKLASSKSNEEFIRNLIGYKLINDDFVIKLLSRF